MAAAPAADADARPRTRWWEWLFLAFLCLELVLAMPPFLGGRLGSSDTEEIRQELGVAAR